MDNTYPPQAWRDLGKELERRRGQLGYGYGQRARFLQERGGMMSAKTLARLERGERYGYPDSTIAAFEALYLWEPGSFERALQGNAPVPSPGTPGAPAGAPGPEYDDPGLQEIWETSSGLPEGARRELVRLAARMRDANRRGNDGEQLA